MSVANFEDYRDTFQCSFSQWPYSKAVVMVEIFSYKKILNMTPKGLQKIQARLSLPKLALPQPKNTILHSMGLPINANGLQSTVLSLENIFQAQPRGQQ